MATPICFHHKMISNVKNHKWRLNDIWCTKNSDGGERQRRARSVPRVLQQHIVIYLYFGGLVNNIVTRTQPNAFLLYFFHRGDLFQIIKCEMSFKLFEFATMTITESTCSGLFISFSSIIFKIPTFNVSSRFIAWYVR